MQKKQEFRNRKPCSKICVFWLDVPIFGFDFAFFAIILLTFFGLKIVQCVFTGVEKSWTAEKDEKRKKDTKSRKERRRLFVRLACVFVFLLFTHESHYFSFFGLSKRRLKNEPRMIAELRRHLDDSAVSSFIT